MVVVSTVLRLLWAASLGLGNDESYYYLFTLHPDWSYFDHPPMTAGVEAFGLWVTGWLVGPTGWGLRLGFVGLGAGSTWLMARLAGRFFGDWAGGVGGGGVECDGVFRGGGGGVRPAGRPVGVFLVAGAGAVGGGIGERDLTPRRNDSKEKTKGREGG